MEREVILNNIKNVCDKEVNVKMSFVFGSFATYREMPESDIDVAVYLENPDDYMSLWNKIDSAVQRNTDLIVLNTAGPSISLSALRGIHLLIKDYKFYLNYMLKISSEAEDFCDYVIDFFNQRKKIRNGSI
ncbi:MAG: nucleotidyltransferase domain-containing protein [Actinobacteria bacterium]|nr:nucleotidyltransferase domain-containing protein [Actinomycetota bacterium]MCL5408594.1 nucleotidyltransferase domain-containing protein [Candidatus Omnitrophota bacterium]